MKHFRKLSHSAIIAGLALASLTVACTTEAPPQADDDDDGPAETSGSGGGGLGGPGPGTGGGGAGDVNEPCAQGAAAFCVCLEAAGESACTQGDFEDLYGFCDDGEDNGYLSCFGSYVQNDQIACGDAATGCEHLLPE